MRITSHTAVLHVETHGGARVVYEYANQLAARGHQVAVVHPRRLSRFPAPPAASFSQRLRLALGKVRNLVLTPGVSWQPLDKRVRMLYVSEPVASNVPDGDVIFATAWQTAVYVEEYPTSKGEKFYLVMDFAPLTAPPDRLAATWRQPFQKVTISRWLYDQVCDAGGRPENTINIPVAIDHQRFRLTREIVPRPKQAAMFVGYSNYKAPQDGILALEIARQRHPEMSVVVFGQGNSRPRGAPSWFSYHANISHERLVAIYNSSSIFVCSSLAEGFALPPAEAMACGCAVAATDCGGIREFAEHEVTALLSAPGNPESLAHNIIRLLEDEAFRIRLAEAGNQRIRQFTWDRSTGLLERFIGERVSFKASGKQPVHLRER